MFVILFVCHVIFEYFYNLDFFIAARFIFYFCPSFLSEKNSLAHSGDKTWTCDAICRSLCLHTQREIPCHSSSSCVFFCARPTEGWLMKWVNTERRRSNFMLCNALNSADSGAPRSVNSPPFQTPMNMDSVVPLTWTNELRPTHARAHTDTKTLPFINWIFGFIY